MTPRDLAAALAVVIFWGLNFVAAKTAVGEIPPLMVTALRFIAVAALVVPFLRPSRDKLRGILALSVTLGIGHFGLIFLGLSGIGVAEAAIAIQLGVPFSALLAAILFQDRLGLVPWLGMGLAFGGVALLAEEPSLVAPWSLLAVVGSALAWAVSNVMIKRLGDIHPLTLVGWMSLFAAPQLLVLSFLFEHGQGQALAAATWRAWASVGYTVIASSILAYTLWCYLVAKYPLSRVAPFTLLGPVIGFAAGALVLGEALSWEKVVGGILTVIGVAVIELRQRTTILETA